MAIFQENFDNKILANSLSSMPSTSSGSYILPNQPIPAPTPSRVGGAHFECSHKLDNNSLQALQHDDDEDQVHHATTSYLAKQKIKQEALKKVKPGS